MKRETRRAQGAGAVTTVAIAAAAFLAAGLLTAGAQDRLPDAEIGNAVDDALIGDPAVRAAYVDVSAAQGIVTLSGSVDNILAKDRAGTIASTIKGVRAVVNRIEVSAPYRSDAEIDEEVDDALMWDPATESWEIASSVTDGFVTLTGTVDSWQEKELASKVAKGVRGVKGIENNIVVDYETDRDDFEIQQEVRGALRWDVHIDDYLIDVAVDGGEVALEGTVGSLAEKNRAYDRAWVAGVRAVDVEDLEVKWWARDQRLREEKYVEKTDAQIEAAVHDALLYDPRVQAFDIRAESDGGYVTLRGSVDNLKAKRAAARDARSVVGVWGVNNRIKVRPNTPSDSRIENNVADALLRDPYVDRYEIDVSVVDGHVYLSGDVDSTFEKGQADDVASRQAGVREVHNFLTVNRAGTDGYDPYTDEWYLYDYDWYVPTERIATKADWQIQEDIESEFFWSPFVDGGDIDVQVEDGIAHLTGTVDTWSEREAATENALEGGAVVVDNDLAVDYGPEYYRP